MHEWFDAQLDQKILELLAKIRGQSPRIEAYTYKLTYIFMHLFSLSDNNSGGQRTAGDVLNDIGSMLADLTDELDAMLHMDPNQAAAAAAGGNGSAAAGFSKA